MYHFHTFGSNVFDTNKKKNQEQNSFIINLNLNLNLNFFIKDWNMHDTINWQEGRGQI